MISVVTSLISIILADCLFHDHFYPVPLEGIIEQGVTIRAGEPIIEVKDLVRASTGRGWSWNGINLTVEKGSVLPSWEGASAGRRPS